MENNKTFKKNGIAVLLTIILLQVLSVVGIVVLAIATDGGEINGAVFGIGLTIFIVLITVTSIMYAGLKNIKPNEALVLTLFGSFYGAITEAGFYYVNPFVQATNPVNNGGSTLVSSLSGLKMSSSKISLKTMTLNNAKQKVNDANGNPIEIGVVVIWKVIDPIKAVFNVENYEDFVSIQSDSSIRAVARSYVYDGEDGEKSLTGSTKEISDKLKEIIQEAVVDGGIEIIDAKIAHLAYAPEIASAMLQRQQADAIIAARQKIVEGAVGMVEQALEDLSKRNVVELDDERKAQMVTNLLVVLCANKEAQPIVNSGSIY